MAASTIHLGPDARSLPPPNTVADTGITTTAPVTRPFTRRLLSMSMINTATSTGTFMALLYPYINSTNTLVRAMGLDQIGDDASLMSLQTHVEVMGFRRFEMWRAGPVGDLHWQHSMIGLFGRVERLLPVMEHLQNIGEHILCEMATDLRHGIRHLRSDSDVYLNLMRCIEHSRKFAVLAHTGVVSTWRYAVTRFRDHLQQVRRYGRGGGVPTARTIATSAAVVSPPPAQRFEDVHIRLTAKEYRSTITPMRGALKRRSDPKVPDNCAICLDTLLLRRTWHGLACGHVFHPKCLKVWLQTQCRKPVCPLCRYDVRTPKKNTTIVI